MTSTLGTKLYTRVQSQSKIVYKDGKSDIDSSRIENKTEDNCDGFVDGVYNRGFEKDDESAVSKSSQSIIRKEPDGARHNEQNVDDSIVCCSLIKKKRSRMVIIFVSVIFTCLLIASAIVLWVLQTTNAIIFRNYSENKDFIEEDNHTPINYTSDSKNTLGPKVRIFSRLEWLAQPPVDKIDVLKLPVSLIIIQHTSTEGCDSQGQCIFQTRVIQSYHIESRGWYDIAYNFLLGGDGNAYEGRGWKIEGAHTYGYNNISIGIAFIGTFNTQLPTPRQIHAFHKLLEKGVRLGYITEKYKILAARQLYATESPGKRLYDEIKTWKHWSNKYQ